MAMTWKAVAKVKRPATPRDLASGATILVWTESCGPEIVVHRIRPIHVYAGLKQGSTRSLIGKCIKRKLANKMVHGSFNEGHLPLCFNLYVWSTP